MFIICARSFQITKIKQDVLSHQEYIYIYYIYKQDSGEKENTGQVLCPK